MKSMEYDQLWANNTIDSAIKKTTSLKIPIC